MRGFLLSECTSPDAPSECSKGTKVNLLTMKYPGFFSSLSEHRRAPIALLAAALVAAAPLGVLGAAAQFADDPAAVAAAQDDNSQAGDGTTTLGQTSGLLAREKLVLDRAIQVDLDKETVRLPLYKGTANGQTVWFVLLDASDLGLAHDLGVNYAPKLANIAIGCATCVQEVNIESPTPDQHRFGHAVVHFKGAPDFSPTRVLEPGPNAFPPAKPVPAAVAGPGYSPFIRIAGPWPAYTAPIVATGDGPFDVVHHINTGDRVLGVHIAPA